MWVNCSCKSTVDGIVSELIDHSVSLAHNRHLSNLKCKEMGLVIKDLETDQKLQDRVLSIHHIYCHTLSSTAAFKIIENNLGVAYIQQAQQVFIQAGAMQKASPLMSELQSPEPIAPKENENAQPES